MIDALSIAQSAMTQDQQRLQSISQNIANMNTPGYKRQVTETLGFKERLENQTIQTHNVQQGNLSQSNDPNNIALSGKGFFVVQNEEGTFYTRRGDLHRNENGELSTIQGALILGKNGPILVNDNSFKIDTEGNVFINGQLSDQLKQVTFDSIQQLSYRGEGLFESREAIQERDNNTQILQGFLEQSNVKSLDEMGDILKTMRHFASSQKVMHCAAELLTQAIRQLGEGNV